MLGQVVENLYWVLVVFMESRVLGDRSLVEGSSVTLAVLSVTNQYKQGITIETSLDRKVTIFVLELSSGNSRPVSLYHLHRDKNNMRYLGFRERIRGCEFKFKFINY